MIYWTDGTIFFGQNMQIKIKKVLTWHVRKEAKNAYCRGKN